MHLSIEARAKREKRSENVNSIIYVLAAVAIFLGGYHAHDYFHTCPLPEAPKVIAESETNVQTEVAYVPKTDKADIDVQIGKPELVVKVNGQETAVQKTDAEKYVFDKNKLSLQQTSKAELNIEVPVIDKTRRYTLGVGMSEDGLVGMVDFPISRKEYVGCWIAGNDDNVMGGLTIKF